MIQGLKVHVDTNELREILTAQAAYHSQKADGYAKQAAAYQASGLASMTIPNSSNRDPVEQFESKEAQHRDDAQWLGFCASHLAAGETYELDTEDLRRIGVLKGYR